MKPAESQEQSDCAEQVTLVEAAVADRDILANLLELYLYDFTEFDDFDLGEDARYGYDYLDYYWTEPGRHALLIRVGGRLAGFVLVRTVEEGHNPLRSIAEFFVLRKYRRRGVGRSAAVRVFDMFPGRWSVGQEASNLPAQVFWRRIIREYTRGQYSETWDADEAPVGPRQLFTTGVCSRPNVGLP